MSAAESIPGVTINNFGTILFTGPLIGGTPGPHSPDELDITTGHVYEAPPSESAQQNFDGDGSTNAPSTPEPSVSPTAATPPVYAGSAVSLTPRNPTDQREEIAMTSERNEHLMNADRFLSLLRSRRAWLERIDVGLEPDVTPGQIATAKANKTKYRRESERELLAACGACALKCPIRSDFPAWARIHGSATVPRTADQEPFKAWRKRHHSDRKRDPPVLETHCLPPRKPAAIAQEAA